MPRVSTLLSFTMKGLFLPLCLILVLQAAASRMLSVTERDLPIPGFSQIPSELGGWKSNGEQAIESTVAAYLKPDDYVLRDYVSPAAGSSINVFIAYFKSLQNAYGPHSPKVCLPGSGWLVRSSSIRNITIPGRPEGFPANYYVLEKAGDRILVIYWYQNNRHIWAEEFQAKLTMLPDLIRYRRSDASLVRLIAPVLSADGEPESRVLLEFTKLMFPPLLERFSSVQ